MKQVFSTLLLIFLTISLSAQITPFTEKFFLNFELNTQTLTIDDNENVNDRGGGLGLRVGYGFTPTFAMYLGFTGAQMREGGIDSYGVGIAEMGTRLHFGKKLRSPTFYLDLSFQAAAARVDAPDISFSGGGVGLGAGLLVYVGKELALDFGLRGSGGRFNQFEIGDMIVNIDQDNVRYGVGRLSVGITWFSSGN
jgi:hypothetical protein